MGVSGGIQKSPSLLRNGSLQSNSSSTTTGSGEEDAETQNIAMLHKSASVCENALAANEELS